MKIGNKKSHTHQRQTKHILFFFVYCTLGTAQYHFLCGQNCSWPIDNWVNYFVFFKTLSSFGNLIKKNQAKLNCLPSDRRKNPSWRSVTYRIPSFSNLLLGWVASVANSCLLNRISFDWIWLHGKTKAYNNNRTREEMKKMRR